MTTEVVSTRLDIRQRKQTRRTKDYGEQHAIKPGAPTQWRDNLHPHSCRQTEKAHRRSREACSQQDHPIMDRRSRWQPAGGEIRLADLRGQRRGVPGAPKAAIIVRRPEPMAAVRLAVAKPHILHSQTLDVSRAILRILVPVNRPMTRINPTPATQHYCRRRRLQQRVRGRGPRERRSGSLLPHRLQTTE